VPDAKPIVADVDTNVLIAAGVAVATALVALFALISKRRLSNAVDHAIDRIGGAPAKHWWHRPAVLRSEVRVLEDQVAESHRDRARLGAAVATAPIGILLTNDEGEILVANEAASNLLNLQSGETVPEGRLRQAIEAASLSRRPVSRAIDLPTPEPRHLQVDVLALEHGVESVGALAYVRDLTEERRASTLRSDFVANVGRELKAPLGALAALAGSLADQATDPVVAARLADRLGEEAVRLSEVIDDMLDLSEAEAVSRPQSTVRIDALLAGIAEELAPVAGERSVDLAVDLASGALVVWGERRQLHTLLAAIVENAIEYSRQDGVARTPRVSVRARRSENRIVVVVEDEGIGIPEEHLTRVFERFYRVDPTRAGTGPGLGLALASHIARNHGGAVTVESRVGVGSTFRVSLPAWEG